MNRKFALAATVAAAFAFTPVTASAVLYHYVDWTSANVGGGTASGTITLPDASTVTVDNPLRYSSIAASDALDKVLWEINLTETGRRLDETD